MEANTSTHTGTKRRRASRARIDKDRQEAVIDKSAVLNKEGYLVGLYKAQESAATEFSDAIKAVAEKSGLNAAPVRAYIIAKAGEEFEKAQKKVQQLSLLFED